MHRRKKLIKTNENPFNISSATTHIAKISGGSQIPVDRDDRAYESSVLFQLHVPAARWPL